MFMLTHFFPPLFDNTRHKATFLGEIVPGKPWFEKFSPRIG